MTSKERAALRAQANGLDVLFQVGKGGISDALIEQTDGALRTRELIKLRVLTETSPVSPREAAFSLSAWAYRSRALRSVTRSRASSLPSFASTLSS